MDKLLQTIPESYGGGNTAPVMMHKLMIVLVCVMVGAAHIQGKTHTLGVLIPYTGTWPIGYTSAGATTAALNKINLDQDLTILRQLGADFKFVWEDTKCLEEVGLVKLVDLWIIHQVDVFIGMF